MPGFVDFKQIVWHESFWLIIQSIAKYTTTGYGMTCGDGKWRILMPLIFLLSADYEEQYVYIDIDL